MAMQGLVGDLGRGYPFEDMVEDAFSAADALIAAEKEELEVNNGD